MSFVRVCCFLQFERISSTYFVMVKTSMRLKSKMQKKI
jgi:hypothetical protein